MYARFFSFKAKPGTRSDAEALADRMFGFARSLPGFVYITYLISEDEMEYGSFSVWKTKAAADTAGDAIRQKAEPALHGMVTEPPQVVVYEVYEPKS